MHQLFVNRLRGMFYFYVVFCPAKLVLLIVDISCRLQQKWILVTASCRSVRDATGFQLCYFSLFCQCTDKNLIKPMCPIFNMGPCTWESYGHAGRRVASSVASLIGLLSIIHFSCMSLHLCIGFLLLIYSSLACLWIIRTLISFPTRTKNQTFNNVFLLFLTSPSGMGWLAPITIEHHPDISRHPVLELADTNPFL